MKGRMLVFDLDGTCITDNYHMTENLINLVKNLSKDNLVILATGRSVSDAFRYYKMLQLDSEMICYNGAFMFSIYDNHILINKYMEEQIEILLYLKSQISVGKIDNIIISQGIFTYRLNDNNAFMCDMMFDSMLPWYLKDIDFMISEVNGVHRIIVSVLPEMRKTMIDDIKRLFREVNIYAWKGREDIIDISIGGVDKWDAVLQLAEMKNISRENIIVFGDSDNDINMIQNAGIGVCVLNGSIGAKAVAEQITLFSNNYDGVYHHLKQLAEEI